MVFLRNHASYKQHQNLLNFIQVKTCIIFTFVSVVEKKVIFIVLIICIMHIL
ncbi:Uncharacterised protein [Neisseria gonorrhoeae]|uniref:Uncharacterized protein n=1 Tax=Neisseria gonorrhoeae TaxID=485 RepID=A0A379B1C0_NEIGO|nr:Uncharacterised protein [Neisseria gonorrhoeae]